MLPTLLVFLVLVAFKTALSASTQGIVDLVQRHMPNHVDDFSFALVYDKGSNDTENDRYTVAMDAQGKISVQGNSISALAVGYDF